MRGLCLIILMSRGVVDVARVFRWDKNLVDERRIDLDYCILHDWSLDRGLHCPEIHYSL